MSRGVTAVGIANFNQVDTFLVRQEVEAFEAFSNIETSNSYVVLASAGTNAKARYLVVEDSPYYGLAKLLGSKRPFTLKVIAVGLNDQNATARTGFLGSDVDAN